MKPIVSVLIINIGLLIVWLLISHFVFHEMRMVMFFTGFQALINLAACVILYLDRKRKDNRIVYSLLVGFGLMAIVTVVVWFMIQNAAAPLPELEVPA